jgi:ABC-2 type transport system permease protein
MRKYWSIFQIQLSNRLAYIGDLLTQSTSIVVFLFVFLQLWKATYTALGTDEIAGMTLEDTLWYLMLAETITLSKRTYHAITAAVKDGSIAYLLNKPFNFRSINSLGLADEPAISLQCCRGALVWI